MKRFLALMMVVFFVLIVFSCKKTNRLEVVSGTINGTPTITLYGTIGPTDYVLVSTDPTKVEMEYQGDVFPYTIGSPDSIIYITTSPSSVVKGALYKSGSTTKLDIITVNAPKFASEHYISY